MGSQPLFDTLQREFCPPLDSSLLAALLAEVESDGHGNLLSPSSYQIEQLRSTLRELATQADESQLCEELSDFRLTSPTETNSSSTPDFYLGDTATTSSQYSDSSGSSQHSFSSPLGFLQAALPHIPTAKLNLALCNAREDEEMDMWNIVAGILSDEFVREMEERGLDGLVEDGELENGLHIDETPWETVESKRKSQGASKASKRKNNRGKKITVVDIRQQQHSRPPPSRTAAAVPDPWTQLSSISTHVATLLPPHPASYFQSFFHSPQHATPYHALCSALASICNLEADSATDEHVPTLINLLDVLLPSYESLDSEQHSRLISDIQLSLSATRGRADDTIDLVKLLRDLDSDSALGYLEMGVYHLPSPSPPDTREQKLPTGPPPIQPPPPAKTKHSSPSPTRQKPSPFQWQAVPRRKTLNTGSHPSAQHIPAYTRDVNGIKVRGSGNGLGKGGKGDVGELEESRRKMGESMRRRNEYLKEASKMWQKGNFKTRGGEVAFYFAERAREFQELAKAEALNAARTMVESKRMTSHEHDTLDLHGTTVAEAIVIVKETLLRHDASPNKPLKVITGRGKHSANQIGVLKPAIKKALLEEGWNVGTWDGGLVVRGKRGRAA